MKTFSTIVATSLMLVGGYTAIAQQGDSRLYQTKATTQTMGGAPMQMCKRMMSDMNSRNSQMKDMDAKIDGLVSTMDSATGEDKVNAMSVVVKELVSQRTVMRMKEGRMDSKMRDHMMQHMKMPMKSGKMDCPMMNGMMDR